MSIIEVKNLVKEYKVADKKPGMKGQLKNLVQRKKKIVRAVDDISFNIEKGEILAYIGPNGAGKSTTVKMLSGILTPSSGSILIDGLSPTKERKKVVKNLGVVFGQRTQLNWDLRLGESFELMKRIYDIPSEIYNENYKMMDEILGIEKFINTPVRHLSLGQRMRGDLVAAMLHSPEILFLDEPTIGLDVDGKHAIREFIKEVNRKKNTTVILTTHDLGDIQELCKRLIIINDGKIIEDGSLDELVDRIAPYRDLIVDFYEDTDITHPDAKRVSYDGMRAIYRFNKKDTTAAKIITDISSKTLIKDISLEEASIEDIISVAYHQKE